MRIESDDYQSRIDIELIDKDGNSDLHFSVSVDNKGFRGDYDGIWVFKEEFQTFINELRTCEETRQSCACMSSMSPREFDLVIESAGGVGDYLLRFSLSRHTLQFGRSVTLCVAGGFALEPSFLPKILREFEEFL